MPLPEKVNTNDTSKEVIDLTQFECLSNSETLREAQGFPITENADAQQAMLSMIAELPDNDSFPVDPEADMKEQAEQSEIGEPQFQAQLETSPVVDPQISTTGIVDLLTQVLTEVAFLERQNTQALTEINFLKTKVASLEGQKTEALTEIDFLKTKVASLEWQIKAEKAESEKRKIEISRLNLKLPDDNPYHDLVQTTISGLVPFDDLYSFPATTPRISPRENQIPANPAEGDFSTNMASASQSSWEQSITSSEISGFSSHMGFDPEYSGTKTSSLSQPSWEQPITSGEISGCNSHVGINPAYNMTNTGSFPEKRSMPTEKTTKLNQTTGDGIDPRKKKKNRILASVPEIGKDNPVAVLTNFCKHYLGFDVEFKASEEDGVHILAVYFSGEKVVSASNISKKTAKKLAAESAIRKLHEDESFLNSWVDRAVVRSSYTSDSSKNKI